MDFLSGIIERITYHNEENGFTVFKIKSAGFSDLVPVLASCGSINVGATVKLYGQWKVSQKHGKQFEASKVEESVPASVAGIEKYLGSGLIKGIGPVYAKKITKLFGANTIAVLDNEPEKLTEVSGIGEKRIEMIKKAWAEQKEIKNIMIFLQQHMITTSFAVKIYKTYGETSIEVVKNNPYRLAYDIWGIGFRSADKIAQSLGFAKDSHERIKAGILYTMSKLSEDGHCFAYFSQIEELGEPLLEIEKEKIATPLEELVKENQLKKEKIEEEGQEKQIYYLPPFYFGETGSAKRLKSIKGVREESGIDIDSLILQIEKSENLQYADAQKEAVKIAADSKLFVLTGGPGTGKTTVTLAIIKLFERMNLSVLLCAPTGRAAKRMTEVSGRESVTIHRLLEYSPMEGYGKNAENPLDCHVLIIDECSMIDILLFYNLLKAVPDNTRVVMVGDADQIPSVGAGNVLKDIINSGAVPVVKLDTVFRQAQGSRIITNAHKINKGLMIDTSGGQKSDFFFIEADDPQKAVETVVELCTKRLPQYYKADPFEDIQILCPMIRGDVGITSLNARLQEELNKNREFIKYAGSIYKAGDRVMQIRNNYDKNVYNGDIGRVKEINLEDSLVTVLFDGLEVNYEISELDELVLAYAVTIHKSQGSEYPIVVSPVMTQHYMMLQRNLLYTCVTRAKKVFVLVGSKKALSMSIRNNKSAKRNTRLAERLV